MSEETPRDGLRKAMQGWKQMTKQPTATNQSQPPSVAQKKVVQLQEEEIQERPSMKSLKESYNANKTSSFVGNGDQVLTKLCVLFTEETEMGVKHKSPKILRVEQLGFNKYRIEYVP
jgi:hypothetical protein